MIGAGGGDDGSAAAAADDDCALLMASRSARTSSSRDFTVRQNIEMQRGRHSMNNMERKLIRV